MKNHIVSLVSCLLSFAALTGAAMPKLSGNLRNYADEKAAFLKEIAAETNANKLAVLKLAYAKFEYASAKDDTPQKWRDAQVVAYETPGVDNATKLEMLKSGVWSKDYEKEGIKVAGDNQNLLYAYFNQMFFVTRFGASGIEEKGSSEHRLALAEKGMKLLHGANRQIATSAYSETLGRLHRYAEQEKFLRERLDAAVKSGNLREQAPAYRDLGSFYSNRAKRYYDDPEPTLLRKALDCYEREVAAIKTWDAKVHFWQYAVWTAFALEDYDAVARLLKDCRDTMTAHTKGQFPPNAQLAEWEGDLCYFRGDYEGAVKAYSSVPSLQARPVWNECGRCAWDRYAESLYVLGRYEECLKVIPKLCGWASLTDRNRLYKRILEEKIAAKKETK